MSVASSAGQDRSRSGGVALLCLTYTAWALVFPSSYCSSWVMIPAGRRWAPPSPVCIEASGPAQLFAPWGWGDNALVVGIAVVAGAEVVRRLRRRHLAIS